MAHQKLADTKVLPGGTSVKFTAVIEGHRAGFLQVKPTGGLDAEAVLATIRNVANQPNWKFTSVTEFLVYIMVPSKPGEPKGWVK